LLSLTPLLLDFGPGLLLGLLLLPLAVGLGLLLVLRLGSRRSPTRLLGEASRRRPQAYRNG
jgi:hypothetical protein